MAQNTRQTYRERLFEFALDHRGFVTTNDARALGIPTIELRKLAHRGKLEQVSRGVYQFPQLAGSVNESFLRATLYVGADAYLTADAVLAVHDLANVNPRIIRVGTNKRVRHELPKQIKVLRTETKDNLIEVHNGIRATRVSRAIIDSKGLVMNSRLQVALAEAFARGLVTETERKQVELALA